MVTEKGRQMAEERHEFMVSFLRQLKMKETDCMSHLIVNNLTKTVGDKTLFQRIEFTINEGDRAGLIGINGTGKSTLLSILAGVQDADSISLDHPNKYRIAYLEQDPAFPAGMTVLQAVFDGDSPILQLNREYEEAVAALAGRPDSEQLQNTLFALQQKWIVKTHGISMHLPNKP